MPASLVSVFASSVLPVLLVAGAGFLLGRFRDPDPEPINTLVVYVLMPALVFHTLVTTDLGGGTALSLVAAMLAFTFGMLGLAAAVGRGLDESGPRFSALLLSASFPNVGNFGIPVAAFAFGAVGRSVAVLFVIVQNVLLYTLGVYLVSRGSGEEGRAAVGQVFALPLVYAVLAAGVVRLGGLPLDPRGTTLRTVELLGDASIPLFLLILGLQLAESDPGAALSRAAPAVGLKLLAAPVVGAAVGVALLPPETAAPFVVLCAAPVAVTPLVLHVEFGGAAPGDPDRSGALTGPEYVSTAVFATLLGALPVVTGLLYLFG